MKRKNFPRIMIAETIPEGHEKNYPWKEGDSVLVMGEITNMPGHVVVATKNGKVHWGYHPEDFRKPTDDEI